MLLIHLLSVHQFAAGHISQFKIARIECNFVLHQVNKRQSIYMLLLCSCWPSCTQGKLKSLMPWMFGHLKHLRRKSCKICSSCLLTSRGSHYPISQCIPHCKMEAQEASRSLCLQLDQIHRGPLQEVRVVQARLDFADIACLSVLSRFVI